MAASLIDSVGLTSGVLGIVGFTQDNIPDKPPQGTNIRVKLGLGGDNNHGIFSPGTRAEYVGVAAEKDAVCIPWITVKMHDGTPGCSWTGDIGAECGQNWFHQTESAGNLDKDAEKPKTPYIPKCTWLDEGHTGGKPSAALKFKTLAYGEKAEDTVGQNKACYFTKWGPENGPTYDKPGKRAPKPHQEWMQDRLIMSKLSQHTVESLCSSDTSYWPDFVGLDGMFCDMGSKTLTPLCSTKQINGCLNVDSDGKVITKRSSVARRQVQT